MTAPRLLEFDRRALFRDLDRKRVASGLNWRGVADDIWDLSSELNARHPVHPISPSTIQTLGRSGFTTCHIVLFYLRWLGRSPEDYLRGGKVRQRAALPVAGPDRRLRWDIKALYEALNSQRESNGLTWPEVATEVGCTANQLRGLRTASYGADIQVAMRITQWLGRPAADFVYAAKW